MENEKIKNNYKLAKNDINQYIKKLRIESLQIKNKAKEYLKENKREKAKSQLIRRKRFNSQIIDSINLLKYFKGQIIKGLEIKKKIISK